MQQVPSPAEIAQLEAAVAAADAVIPPLEEEVAALQEALMEQRSGFYELRGSLQVKSQWAEQAVCHGKLQVLDSKFLIARHRMLTAQ